MKNRPRRRGIALAAFVCTTGLALAGLLVATPGHAASIPVWLDDAISAWNDENAATPITFVDIKDQYIWYTVDDTEEIGAKRIRTSIYDLVQQHGYEVTDQEERITTGKPPSATNPYKRKKCWSRSFVRNVEELSNTKMTGAQRSGMRQTMLTSLVCEDEGAWYTGFRILQ